MALGRQRDRQSEMLVSWSEMPRSPGHAFYDRLQAELVAGGFDGFVEGLCAEHYSERRGRPSLPPGRYFRMLLVGYFEGIDSERGLEWRCADSLSLREFLRLGERERVPDHSWLSRTRSRLPLDTHDAVFTWVLRRLAGVIEAAIDDMTAAARAVAARAVEFGVDPARIVLGGWSAGGRAAVYAAYAERAPCIGVLSLSGLMAVEDVAAHMATGAAQPPLLMIVAEQDIGYLRDAAPAMARAMRERGCDARLLGLPGRDHWYAAEARTDAGLTVQ